MRCGFRYERRRRCPDANSGGSERLLKSLEDSAITAFAGVELFSEGTDCLHPERLLDFEQFTDQWCIWSNDTLSELIEKVPGILIASHPYSVKMRARWVIEFIGSRPFGDRRKSR